MTTYSYDNKSLLRDGKRWFPMMGEIHYSRVPADNWKEELLKMKAGGIDIVSCYAIWIHHEEIEGEWDFSGSRDLRKFIQTVKECGLTMILRVGPWCHGEVRNGGFPDWLLQKLPKRVRCNDEGYLSEVRLLFAKYAEQAAGLLLKDGGPIIGLQIENEYGHCGGLQGAKGEEHMQTLTTLAKEAGFDVPLYTATGWGGAVTAGLLPVMGGYCDAPWDARTTEIEPSGNFVFTYERNDHAIGSDYGIGHNCTFDMTKEPYLTAELGGGLQVTSHRRTIAQAADISAMSITKMGSGCTLLGYYMYHGGTNPEGKLTTLEENKATGSPNDLPVLSYDFRAPIGEFGEINETYHALRRIALFIHDYGEEIAGMDTVIPADNPLDPADFTHLRYSWRFGSDGDAYLFVNNYVRHHKMADHPKTELTLPDALAARLGYKTVTLLNVHDGDHFYVPVQPVIDADTMELPLCTINGIPVAYRYRGGKTQATAERVLLSAEDSLKAYKICGAHDGKGSERLVVTDNAFYSELKNGELIGHATEYATYNELLKTIATNPHVSLYPPATLKPAWLNHAKDGFSFHDGAHAIPKLLPPLTFTKEAASTADKAVYTLAIDINSPLDLCGTILSISYTGNKARLFRDGKLVADHFYLGEAYPWRLEPLRYCKQYDKKLTLTLEIDALHQNEAVYLEAWPEFNGESSLAQVNSMSLIPTAVGLFTL